MKLKLPDNVSSSQDVMDLVIEARDYARWINHDSIKKRVNPKSKTEPPTLSPITNELINMNSIDQSNLDELIDSLESYADKAPSITITLAAAPTGDIKTSLTGWCRKNLASNILVNFRFNSTLLGGMVVRYGSHIFDWSFRRQILESGKNFPEVLRRV